MPFTARVVDRFRDLADVAFTPGAGVDGYAMVYDHATGKLVPTASVLDADTVDGQHASAFALASHTHPLSALSQSGATTGQAAVWNGSAWAPGSAGVTDHGALTGLADDDHAQYVLVDGSRAMTGALLAWDGTGLSVPGIAFANDPDTGIWRWNSGQMRFTVNGASALNLSGSAIVGYQQATFNAPTASSSALVVKGAVSQTANLQEWQNSSATVLASVSAAGAFRGPLGSVSAPAFAGGTSNNAGLYFSGTDVSLSAGGVQVFYTAFSELKFSYAVKFNNSVTAQYPGSGGSLLFWLDRYRFKVTNMTASEVPETIIGAASQTANLTEWQNSAGTVLASVSAAGRLLLPNATASSGAHSLNLALGGGINQLGSGNYDITAYAKNARACIAWGELSSAAAVGFLGATPVNRQAFIADPSGGATVDAEARTAITAVITALENYGLLATS